MDVMRCISREKALEALENDGYAITSITAIDEGSNHFVFHVTLADGRNAICKFTKIRSTEAGLQEEHRDTLFGGLLSLEREAYIFRMVRERAGVPTPEVYGIHDSVYGKYILIEYMHGMSQKACMFNSGFSANVFLNSMYELGKDFARIQNVKFDTFGNIMDKGLIEPEGMNNFADRFLPVINRRLARCSAKEVFSSGEQTMVSSFFHHKLEDLRSFFDKKNTDPVLVFTDMHAENFFTDDSGRPTAYFDLESAQAAPAALEYYGFRMFLFNFYDQDYYKQAEAEFLRGYAKNGGTISFSSPEAEKAVDFLSACRILELSESYWGYIDGIRDTWGKEMKALLMDYIQTGCMNYMKIGNIWRQRDRQPTKPLNP